jgi:simple sugar transport system ATP-binding protein
MDSDLLELRNITRSFGTARAVDDVSLTIAAGEVVGLAGENGAGKTTLMRIVAGELRPDAGTLTLDGRAALVHQHFMLVSEFTVAENLTLATGRRDARAVIAASGIAFDGIERRAGDLTAGEKSKLELIKAIATSPRLLILDEPTSVLTPVESAELFRVIERLAAAGTSVVFISHKIREVLVVARRVIVMRRGRVVADGTGMTPEALANAMVELSEPEMNALPSRPFAGEVLRIDGLTLHPHEILAVAGVAGNGQRELAERVYEAARPDAGFIPEDRTRDGIVAQMTIEENLALGAPRHSAVELIERYSIRASGPRQLAGSLSGGNQQKVLLARELDRRPRVIVACEPTRGLDLEATRFVHAQLRAAAAEGAAILMITSDLDEAFTLATAVQVINRGRLSERMSPAEAAPRVANLMAGLP